MTRTDEIIETLKRHHFGRTNFLTEATGGSYRWRRQQIGAMPELRRHNPSGDGQRDARYPKYFHRIYSLASERRKFNWHQVFNDDIMLSVEAAARIAKLPMRHRADILKGKPFRLPAEIKWTFEGGHTEHFDKDVEPDDFFQVGDEFIVIEADCGSESQNPHTFKDKKSILRSLLQYQHILANKTYRDWGIPHLRVLFAFDKSGRLPHAMNVMRTIEMKSRSIFFTDFPDFDSDRTVAPKPALDIFERPLLRVGYEPFYLKPKEVLNGQETGAHTGTHQHQGSY